MVFNPISNKRHAAKCRLSVSCLRCLVFNPSSSLSAPPSQSSLSATKTTHGYLGHSCQFYSCSALVPEKTLAHHVQGAPGPPFPIFLQVNVNSPSLMLTLNYQPQAHA